MSSHVQFACIIEHGADIQSHLKCDDSKICSCHIVNFVFIHATSKFRVYNMTVMLSIVIMVIQ